MKGPVEIGDVSPRRYFTILAVVLGLLFAFIAGDDDSAAALLSSLLLWQLQSIVPMLLLLAAHMAWLRLRAFEAMSAWLQLLISGVTGALLFAPLATLLDHYLEDHAVSFGMAAMLDEAWNITPPITLSWIAINAPFVLGLRLRSDGRGLSASVGPVEERAARTKPSESAPGLHSTGGAPVSLPAFLQLVPVSLRGRLLYLQAELHYLAVVTDRGRSLILYNLRDAVAELEPASGLLTHRSFWVASGAIAKLQRRGRQGVIVTSNGDEIPVSRRRIDEVSAALAAPTGLTA